MKNVVFKKSYKLNFTFCFFVLFLFSFTLGVKFKAKTKSEGMMEILSDLFNQIGDVEKLKENRNANKTESSSKSEGFSEIIKKKLLKITPIDFNEKVKVGENKIKKENMEVIYEGWLKIYSEKYSEENEFPPIFLPDGTKLSFTLDNEGYLNNPSFKFVNPDVPLPSSSFFYFRLSKTNLYYSISKKELHILNALNIHALQTVEPYNDYEQEGTCFQLHDKERKNWKLCALDVKEKNNWICVLSRIIGLNSERCTKKERNYNITEIETKIEKPVIVIPYPSKHCNENWDYFKKGADWECECSEGKEQSPIDLPLKEDAIETSLRPIFQYNQIDPVASESTLDGNLKAGENLKIIFKENMLRIMHPNFGRVITFDGTIYQAEEIQFHTPAEHTVNGKRYDMEMQVIHYGITKGDIGKQLVLCFLFEAKAGKYNQFINDIDFFNLPNRDIPESEIKNPIFIPKIFRTTEDADSSEDVKSMKPFSLYSYEGSMTSPPCVENTIVVVSSDIVHTSVTALNMFKEAIGRKDYVDGKGNILVDPGVGENYRNPQNLNGRPVFYFDCDLHCPKDPAQPPKKKIVAGHYEKFTQKKQEYLYVSGPKPSGVPDAFVVGKDEVDKLKEFTPIN